ncbi:MAG: four helix bundle protein [Armatimonadota bacterium]
MADFEKLLVWQKAHQLALLTYEITSDFPHSEHYALRDQIRRAVVSISANIAEGKGRNGDKAFAHFLDVALGSLSEAQALILLARDLDYVASDHVDQFLAQSEEVGKMISSLMARCRKATRNR